jgi:hypothetical protein
VPERRRLIGMRRLVTWELWVEQDLGGKIHKVDEGCIAISMGCSKVGCRPNRRGM